MADGFVLEIPEQLGQPVAAQRKAQAKTREWPAGTRIVSADSHMLEGDLWIDRFPAHLRDAAPRMIFREGGWDLSIGGKSMTPTPLAQHLCDVLECYPGLTDIEARLKDLDIEGVEKELIFPQRLFGLMMFGEIQNREHVFSAYNEAIAEQCAKAPTRLYSVMVPTYWDPEAAKDSVTRCVELDARCLMVPIKPGKFADGKPIQYNHPRMDPLWAAIEASGLPLAFHIGEAIPTAEAGATGVSVLTQMQGFRQNWAQLTFGGIFDRFPGLRVVFVEAGLSWIPGMLHDADMVVHSFPTSVNPKLKHPPSWYWRNHCFATFMTDPVGLELLHRIGPETAMWSSDYPHQESTFGYTRGAIEAVFRACSVEDAQMILGGTALKLFRMDN
ncbi:amidohydrolase family protein [uncultured Phenylobacterium sp.]|uniref:amidohydrolase family protein n=1 Tax=uncultured Phenylobacterium sp. TaxID=349273 RepID=UPI0025CCC490|nr:amidohydrolase family protein [uncultured Phenylobacterium sp.]